MKERRVTWTVEPDLQVESLMQKAITARVGKRGQKRGWRTKIINEALRGHLAYLIGKREAK